jgi:hypothetical protein
MEFKINWKIEIDAETPLDAAREALRVQRDSGSTATVFEVTDENGDLFLVDLDSLSSDRVFKQTEISEIKY